MSHINNMILKGKLNITIFDPFHGYSRGKHVRLTPTGFKLQSQELLSFVCLPQSLLLLAHLIRNGSERVVTSAREHLYDLRELGSYHFVGKVSAQLPVLSFTPSLC